jgi:molybdenum cofactor biosynthesis enzyme MoaA
MPLTTVEKVLQVFGRRHNYHWYNWGEPLLYKEFHEFVQVTRRYRTSISTNLSLKLTDQHFEDLSRLEQVTVSMSGLTEDVYKIYHRGGNFDLVWSNVNRLIGFPNIRIAWLLHPGNEHQRKEAMAWCAKNKFTWGYLHANCEVEESMEGFTHPYLKSEAHYSSKNFQFCKIQRWIPIDVDGNYLLCCMSHNVKTGYTIWDNITPEELRQIKMDMPFCKLCYERGYWKMY